jgi:hypothetical protein
VRFQYALMPHGLGASVGSPFIGQPRENHLASASAQLRDGFMRHQSAFA